MDDTEFIKKFLTQREIEPKRNSCLVNALEDARFLSGRHPKTGINREIVWVNMNEKEMNEKVVYASNSFLGLIGYLILLDMIGSIFVAKKNTIYKTLEKFSTLNDKERDVVVALRNSLTHNYSLINIPFYKQEDETKLHKFELIYLDTPFVISIPSELNKWKRKDFNNKNDESNTQIGVKKLIDEFEKVYSNLKEEYNNGNVSLSNGISVEELKSRFTIRY